MRVVLVLLRKSLLTFSRSKAAVAITFLVPMAIIYLLGNVFGLTPRKDPGPTGIPLAVVNQSPEPAALDLIAALRKEKTFRLIDTTTDANGVVHPLTEADARRGLKDNAYRFVLILPADLLSDTTLGLHIKFLNNPRNEIETQMVNGMLQKTIFSQVPGLLGQSLQKSARRMIGGDQLQAFQRRMADAIADNFGGDREEIYRRMTAPDAGFGFLKSQETGTATDPKTGDATAEGDVFSRIVRIETEQVSGRQTGNPMAPRTVGGYAIMFLLMAVSGSATSLYEEKNSGIFARLLAGPVRPAHILWARFLFGVVLGMLQISALFLAGWFFFSIDIWSHLGALAAVSLGSAAACSAFGMLIVSIASNPHAASGLSTLVVISMSAIGGAWFPVSFMPEFIQKLSPWTLVYWSVESFVDVLWAGYSFVEVLPKVGMLAAIATVISLIAVGLLRRSSMFS